MPGFLITFEGIDFSGKSVQAALLRDALIESKLPVLFLREPGGTSISEKIRTILLDRDHREMSPAAEVLLYSAARSQIVRERIAPHLEQNGVVICDRYVDSTTAYQGYGRGIDLDFIGKLNTFVIAGIKPDVAFLIDLEPDEAIQRQQIQGGAPDRLEQEKIDFHHRVRDGYLQIAHDNKDRFVIIDGSQPIETIQQHVLTRVKTMLHI